MGRQHHGGVGRSRKPRSGHPVRRVQRVCAGGAVRGDTSLAHSGTDCTGKLRGNDTVVRARETVAEAAAMWGTGEVQHVLNPDMPWNEEIRATWARYERFSGSPAMANLMFSLLTELDVRALLPTIRVPTLVMQHTDNALHGAWGHTRSTSLITYPERNMLSCREATCSIGWSHGASLPGNRRVPHRRAGRGGRRSSSRHGAVHRHRGFDAPGRRDGRP